ncbi:DNA primase [Yimella sp. cx-51]|uniref:DNA primase n=1 Tax=Yimella sp. cx-51 TaxID=2770551 RepID=UPI00165D7B9A|nr:DNA primase [Yimella sp. cx-51]MBC9956929.1 DNA primase [Yimella sp. cx-51]QTH39148.1 DNA primase [Yimella sp. cx-51]
MAGLIKTDDIAVVKERASLEEVVREHVTLRSAGPGSLKGLCPFHDEKTPSFTVRPSVGAYHCFGCGKSGDVISFVMEIEHLTFAETVERLAGKYGVELHYEEGRGPRPESIGRRTRLLEAHRVADEFYQEALIKHGEGRTARDFLRARGFNSASCKPFGVGYAPRGGEVLVDVLQRKGFTEDEMVLAGLVGRGRRGLYDRFRGRLVWPIRDITGDTIGFGARRIFDDDRIEAKYLNTTETPIYKKTQVLYGLDLAKKSISGERRAVIVEGYTDVMACHLSGVTQAVATCGTAFGADHIKALRRLIRDEAGQAPGQVVFTFDGDAAGQKAAMKAFEMDQQWAAQSYVAVAPDGMDPCELLLAQGEPAVAALVDSAIPMFEFAVRTTLARFDLATVEGRVQGMRAVAPILKGIRDTALRPAYTREVAGWLGVPLDQLDAEVRRATVTSVVERRTPEPEADEPSEPAGIPLPNFRDPIVVAEMQLLTCILQFPGAVPGPQLMALTADDFVAPAHRAIFEAVMRVGDPSTQSLRAWSDAVREQAPTELGGYVARLSVDQLPTRIDRNTGLPETRFAASLILRVRDAAMRRRIDDVMAQLRQQSTDLARSRSLSAQLLQLQAAHARLATD